MADKLSLVTGASSGIGFSLAQELASRGYDLAICSEEERLESAAEALRGYGVNVLDLQADLATRTGVDELWDWVKSSGRKLDVACLNAGVGVGGLFKDTDLDDELNMIELNCTGTVHLAKHVAREGIDALMVGKDHVYSASMKTKMEGMLTNAIPGKAKGAMHEKMAKPLERKAG